MARVCRGPCPLCVVDDCILSGAEVLNALMFSTVFTKSHSFSVIRRTGRNTFPTSDYNIGNTRRESETVLSNRHNHELRFSRNIPGLKHEARIWDPSLSAQTGTVELPTQV